MYSDTSLYYLNQLGIRPWVERKKNDNIPSMSSDSKELLIFTIAYTNYLVQDILKNIVRYIGLDTNSVLISAVSFEELESIYLIKILQFKPKCILLFGINPPKITVENNVPLVIESVNLENVLNNPVQKKGLLNQLIPVKNLFSNNENV